MARPGLTGHRKFRRLARALGSSIVARGALELLWEHCYESGDDYVGTSDDIEHAVGWTGERGMLTRALVEAGVPEGHGFLEPQGTLGDALTQRSAETGFRIHDLWHHAPDYVIKRRKRELERRQKSEPVLDGLSAERRRTAPTSDWQNGVDRPPAPAPAPAPQSAPAPAPGVSRTASAQDVVECWNALVTAPIPKVSKLTVDRRAKIEQRLRTYPDIGTWRTAIAWINTQDWCRAAGQGNHPNWTATLDWLCRNDGNVARCLERAETDPPLRTAVSASEREQRRNTAKYAGGAR
jgi:hypothetical protein